MPRLFLILFVFTCACAQQTEKADLIFKNAAVYSLSESGNVEAVAIKGNRILALGDNESIETYNGKTTKVYDLQGAMVVPGLIDAHGHLLGLGQAMVLLPLAEAGSWDEIIDMVRRAAEEAEPGTWILGRGWHQEKWSQVPEPQSEGYPHHDALSAVSPDHPVLLRHASGHALFANQAAMTAAGVSASTTEPAGGEIIVDQDGNPIGVFTETAMAIIENAYQRDRAGMSAEALKAEKKKAFLAAQEACLAKGVTSFHDAGVSFADIDFLKQMADEGELKMRLWVMVSGFEPQIQQRLADYRLQNYGEGRLSVTGIKTYVDGALGSRGAWLLAPYSDLPSTTGNNMVPLGQIEALADAALAHDFQLCVHAIGDRGNREVLDLFERKLNGKKLRWRIEHAQHLDPEDIPRFARLGIIASMQGIHCTSDAPFVEPRLGEERAEQGAYMWRALWDSGAIIANGTDTPVEDVDPLPNLHALTTRQPARGEPFYPQQKLTPMEALKATTWNGAYAAFQEDQQGSLEPGKWADLTIISQDFIAEGPEVLKTAEILFTVVGGRIEYTAP